MKTKTSEFKLLSGLFLKLLPYQILLLIITAINGIVDTLYASNMIGKGAMSAIGLFGPLNHFLYAASITFVSGSQVLYGRYLAKDRNRINNLFTVALLISGILSLLTSFLLVTGVHTGATRILAGDSPDIQMLDQYILGQAVGIPALILGQQLFSFMSMENRQKWTMTASICCFVINAICDQLFIVIFSWGTFGLGFATSVSEWLFLAILSVYYFMGKSEWKISVKHCDWHDATQIVKLGYSGALSRFVEMFRCLIINYLILEYVGSVGISSFAASNSVLALFWPVPYGMMAVARMMFSISLGEEDRQSIVNGMKVVMTRGLLIVLSIVTSIILLAEPLTRMFYRDISDPIYNYTVMGFRLLPLCMPWALFSLSFVPYAQAAEKKIISTVLPIVDGLLGVVICSLFLIPLFKMNGLYISNILNGMICTLLIVVSSWIVRKRFPRNMEELLAIPELIGVRRDERIDISITSAEEVHSISVKVGEFCLQHGIDRRRSFFASLCMEEMAGNIIKHGFSHDRKDHSVDIRVVHVDNDIILHIRDNCSEFDPLEYHRIMQSDDTGTNIGIRLVYSIAKNVNYQNLLGMNVLTIRL